GYWTTTSPQARSVPGASIEMEAPPWKRGRAAGGMSVLKVAFPDLLAVSRATGTRTTLTPEPHDVVLRYMTETNRTPGLRRLIDPRIFACPDSSSIFRSAVPMTPEPATSLMTAEADWGFAANATEATRSATRATGSTGERRIARSLADRSGVNDE